MPRLVAGVDCSTQSCKVLICDAESGEVIRQGKALHEPGTEINPIIWEKALHEAIAKAGGIKDVLSISIAGQQHSMVTVDHKGDIVRNAILWNDTRSAKNAQDLIMELGENDCELGKAKWAERIGLVPVASFTITKLRYLAENEKDNLKKTSCICLPHDWLSWRLTGSKDINDIFTDRSDASGTGYFNCQINKYDKELIELATFGSKNLVLPKVVASNEQASKTIFDGNELILGAGCGDNAGAALGMQLQSGQVVISIGTSGVVSLVAEKPAKDKSGYVAGFADATGKYLHLVCTLNASRVIDTYAKMLGVDHDTFSNLALSAPSGAQGLVCIPYLEGERTPNLPNATGALHGIQNNNLLPANIARAAIEGMLCGIGEGLRAIRNLGVEITSIMLIGGGAKSEAIRKIAPKVLGLPVFVPEDGEYVARGAALQATWALNSSEDPPQWEKPRTQEYSDCGDEFIQIRYDEVSHLFSMTDQMRNAK